MYVGMCGGGGGGGEGGERGNGNEIYKYKLNFDWTVNVAISIV